MHLHHNWPDRNKPDIILDQLTPINFNAPMQCINFSEHVLMLISATNYCIWQLRNKLLLNPNNVSSKGILTRILTHISIRKNKEKNRSGSNYLEVRTKIVAPQSNAKPCLNRIIKRNKHFFLYVLCIRPRYYFVLY